MSDIKVKAAEEKLVAIDDTGRIDSKRYHLFHDCSFIKDRKADELVTSVNDREVSLLGLKVCSVCERRKTGGPAIAAIKNALRDAGFDFPNDDSLDTTAWKVMESLNSQGTYVARRGKKDSS